MKKDHYKRIIENAPFGYIHCKIHKDENGHFTGVSIVEANKAFEKLTQLPQDKIIGRSVRDVLPGIDKNGVDCFKVFQTPCGENVTLAKEFQVGNRFFQLHIQFETPETCNMLFDNLTSQMQALEELKEVKQQFEIAIDGTNDGIWDWNLVNNSLFLSPRWKEMLGYEDSELPNQIETFFDLVSDEDKKRVGEYVQKYLQGEIEKYHIEFRMKHKNGSLRWILAKGEALRKPDGKPYRMAGSHSDITDRKEAEASLISTKEKAIKASKAKSEFLANMSHEIRTPLNGVIGFTDLLLNTPLNSAQKQYADNANKAGKALLGIINDILDFSKIEAGKLELDPIETDLIELIEETVDIIKYHTSQKKIELLMNLPISMVRHATFDPVRLKQVLTNLLSNAVKFTEHGEIEIKVLYNEITPTLGEYSFSVRDTGIGISEEQKKKLFQSFSQGDSSTTRKYGGTGLGLVISNLLVEKMGSKIELESTLGEGSTFSFTVQFPIQKDPSKEVENQIEVKRVLVVDDNAQNRLILKDTLEFWGIEFAGCDNGLDCLKILANNKPFDLIIMDYHMPYIDGLETIRKMKADSQITGKSPVIMLHSSSDSHELRQECRQLDVDYFLVKPVKAADLLKHLQRMHKKTSTKEYASNTTTDEESKSLGESKELTILIAEDVDMNMMLAKALLTQMLPDATVIEAKDGLEAVKQAQENNIDLLFMDVQMPNLDGIDATKKIRDKELETGTHIPIVALTAGALTEEKERCLAVGMDDFLSKPISVEALRSIIQKYLFATEDDELSIKEWMTDQKPRFDKNELLTRIGNNPTMYRYSLEISKNLSPKLLLLQKAITEENPEEIKLIAHSIKGAAALTSFNELARLAGIIEANFEADPRRLQKVFQKIEEEQKMLEPIVEKELS